MSKKILSVMLALVMVVSCVAVSAFAGYESEEDAKTYTQTWALSEPVENGDGTWSVDVSLTTNYPTGAIQFVLTNTDNTVAAIKSAKVGSAIPADYAASISASNASGKVIIVPSTVGVDTITATAINGVIATITYTYSGSGSAKIAIKNDPKTETNAAGSLIAARMDDGDVVTGGLVTGQTVASVGVERTIGAASVAPELAVIDGTIGVIDTGRTTIDADEGIECDGYLYGLDADNYETVDVIFEVIGDGEIEIVANDAGSEAGTGTMVNVVDLNGTVVASYVLIVFGDVNGDGAADALDAGDIELHDSYALNDVTGRLLAYQEFAGDVNGDSAADALDAGDIELHDAYALNDDTGRLIISDIIAML
jgi:hypothetical protein